MVIKGMEQFDEILKRLEALEEVVLELRQRVSMLERERAVRVHLSPRARVGRATKRRHSEDN